jgi:DNA-directed RNA polymerase specialized sigma24 family protein
VTDDLEQLYQTTYTAVVRFLYRKVWDAERAEDLAQEVFVRALSHRPEKPRAWVFAVAANLARDEARAAMRRKRHLTLLKGDPVAQPTMTPAADDAVEHAGPGPPPAGGRPRPAAGANGDRCDTFLRTSSTPIWTKG